jgi:hypothetical protein
MMEISDFDVATLRAQIAGNEKAAQQAVADQLTVTGDLTGLAMLVHAALVLAARRRFAPAWTGAEVIQYVAQVRAATAERPGLLDPITAEDELRSALGERTTTRHEIGAVAAARLLLLTALVVTLGLKDDALLGLLDQARNLAREMYSSAQS